MQMKGPPRDQVGAADEISWLLLGKIMQYWSLSEPRDTLHNYFACCLPLCVTYAPTLTCENQRSAPFNAQTTRGNLKPSSTHGRCSESPCKTSSSSHRWSSPTAGYTHPCWRRSLPGRSYLGLGKGRREREREMPQEKSTVKQHLELLLSLNNAGLMQKKCTLERDTACVA